MGWTGRDSGISQPGVSCCFPCAPLVPAPPAGNLRITDVTHSAMKLSWDAAQGQVSRYVISYAPEDGDLREVQLGGSLHIRLGGERARQAEGKRAHPCSSTSIGLCSDSTPFPPHLRFPFSMCEVSQAPLRPSLDVNLVWECLNLFALENICSVWNIDQRCFKAIKPP